jgi:hypothetical protein
VGLTFGVCVSLAACGQADFRNGADVFTTAERAPSEPPTVSIEGNRIAPSYYEWVIDGENITFKASEDQDDAELTHLSRPSRETLSVVLSTAVRPADFRVVFFEDVDENGVPTAASGVEIDCLEDDACSLQTENGELTADVQLTLDPKVMVVHLLYADVVDSDDETKVDHLVGSWGVRFDDREEAS